MQKEEKYFMPSLYKMQQIQAIQTVDRWTKHRAIFWYLVVKPAGNLLFLVLFPA